MNERTGIIYFLSHPIQYFSPLLKELAKQIDLHVYYFSDASISGQKDTGFDQQISWDIPLLEGYQYNFLKNYSRRSGLNNRFFDLFNPGVIRVLRKQAPSIVIINGWTYSSTWMVIFFSRLFGKRIWLRAENPLNQELQKSKLVLCLKKILLKHFLFRFFISKFLYIGRQNKLFFNYYGVPDSSLIYTPYAVDNAFFSRECERLSSVTGNIKRELGLPPDKKIILYCGKYIDKKRPLDLLRAFKDLDHPDSILLMVGEGVLRREMEQYILENRLEQVVFLTGFINQSEISKYYVIADVFVMCSGMGETWGLAVNEAMNFAKPVILSATCGCSDDLVKQGDNGFVFREGDVAELSACMRKALEDDDFRKNAGRASKQIIQGYSNEVIVQNIRAAYGH
jgi:glycosyltransferase involved in cell wall biosynthesis